VSRPGHDKLRGWEGRYARAALQEAQEDISISAEWLQEALREVKSVPFVSPWLVLLCAALAVAVWAMSVSVRIMVRIARQWEESIEPEEASENKTKGGS